MSLLLPLWQRLLITIAAMVLTSYIAGLVWHALFNVPLPGYAAGVVGAARLKQLGIAFKKPHSSRVDALTGRVAGYQYASVSQNYEQLAG